MPTFLFRAEIAKTDAPVSVHITLGGNARGFTPTTKNQYLEVKTDQKGTYSWYAKRNGEVIKNGESSGGEIVVYVT